MIPIVYSLVCLAFYLSFIRFDLIGRSLALFTEFRMASQVISDASLNDLEKEKRIRSLALGTLVQTLSLVGWMVAVLSIAASPVVVAKAATGLEFGAFLYFSLNPIVLVCSVFALAGIERARRVWVRRFNV